MFGRITLKVEWMVTIVKHIKIYGRSTIVKRYGDTKDDIYAAVAYALAKIEFETNSNFKKEVDSCLVILDSKKGKKNGK